MIVLLATVLCGTLQSSQLHQAPVIQNKPITHAHLRSSSSSSSSNPFWGWILGPLLITFSIVLLGYNQKSAAVNIVRLEEAEEEVVTIDANEPHSEQQGMLVHTCGDMVTRQPVVDPDTFVQAANTAVINRIVQKRQRHQRTTDGRTETYQSWDQIPETGSEYAPIKSHRFNARQIMLGAFFLTESQKDQLQKFQDLGVDPAAEPFLRDKYKQNISVIGNLIYFYQGNPQEVGSFRAIYQRVPCGPLTVMSGQKTPTFYPYLICDPSQQITASQKDFQFSCGNCCCCICQFTKVLLAPIEQIDIVQEQRLSKEELFQLLYKRLRTKTWLLRLLSFVCLWIGIWALFSPISELLGYIPLIGGVLKGVLNFLLLLAAFLVALPIWLLLASIVWFFYHPKVALIILAVGGAATGIAIAVASTSKAQ